MKKGWNTCERSSYLGPIMRWITGLRSLCTTTARVKVSQITFFTRVSFPFDTNFSLNFQKVHEQYVVFFCHTVTLAEIHFFFFALTLDWGRHSGVRILLNNPCEVAHYLKESLHFTTFVLVYITIITINKDMLVHTSTTHGQTNAHYTQSNRPTDQAY